MTTVLFAVDDENERLLFEDAVRTRGLDIEVVVFDGDRDEPADITITDLHFQGGAFAEELLNRPHPFILLADWDEHRRISDSMAGRNAGFLVRDDQFRHIQFLPLVVRSVVERTEHNMLLAELHHRVKNNFQVLSSLLNLQSAGLEETAAFSRFSDAQMQIEAMALVHEQLYQTENYATVQLDTYIGTLCDHLYDAYAVQRHRISLDVKVDPISVPLQQAVPIALLLNELVSNSLKHAFPGEAAGTIRISAVQQDEKSLSVEVTDDGIGLPDDFGFSSDRTLGHTLIAGLSSQLNGELCLDGSNGTRFSLIFPL